MTAMPADVPALFLEQSRHMLIEQCWPRLKGCVESLTNEQLWWRPNEACNSIGNLLLHLNGNVREWLVTSFNRLEDNRNRPAEFNQRESISASALLSQLGATIQQASEVLARLTPDDLLARYEIQGYKVSGLEAVYHVVEHFSMHYGQVLYIVKTLQGADLGFYSYLNKTGRAS
jgi:uncharacterized damage-inducible protein DinB